MRNGLVGSSLRTVFGRLALGLVLPATAMGIAVGCSAKDDGPAPFAGAGVDSASSPETVAGRDAARGLLGLAPVSAAPSSTPATAEQKKSASRYEAVVTYLLVLLEQREPGALARYSIEMKSQDEKRIIPAYVGMRGKLERLAEDPALLEMIRKDPLFAGALKTQSSSIFGRVEIRDLPANIPNLGRGADGNYGDGNTGALAAAADSKGLFVLFPVDQLLKVERGEVIPDPESRLGAFAATRGYPVGSVGHAVHNAIGTIFLALGTYGEERIGRVFNSPEARALYNQPVESSAGALMAAIEQRYWANVAAEDSWSPGGQLGAAFSPAVRDFLQRNVFGSSGVLDGGAGTDSGADAGPPTDCGDKTDGFWCIGGGYMAYCKGGSIGGGCPCAACTTRGTPAACAAAPPPAACPVP